MQRVSRGVIEHLHREMAIENTEICQRKTKNEYSCPLQYENAKIVRSICPQPNPLSPTLRPLGSKLTSPG